MLDVTHQIYEFGKNLNDTCSALTSIYLFGFRFPYDLFFSCTILYSPYSYFVALQC